jgi:hypothetical protein
MVADLTALLDQVLGRITELEAQLKQSSKNSSKPPSSDGLAKPAPKSLRKKTGRGPGRPAGQPGTTLEQVVNPDVVVRHLPDVCGGCGNGLAGDVEVAVARRQVFDVPVPTVVVTEHQIVTVACGCGHHTSGAAPAEAPAPVAYGPRLPVIADRIAAAPVACFDETGIRTNGRLAWLHSASTSTDVLLSAHPKRGTATMDAAKVLPRFTGVAVHDAWAPYDTYTHATHALCNAHVLRELVYAPTPATSPTWPNKPSTRYDN